MRATTAMALALDLVSTVPPVAQGERGLDAKGAAIGNASHYYSVPRLAAQGNLTIEGETFAVTGLAWLDREWSTSSLDPGTVGWDWFALHLSDGSNLMFYRLRTTGGEASPFSGGTLVSADGIRTRLLLATWRSRRSSTGRAARRASAIPSLGGSSRRMPASRSKLGRISRIRSSTFRCATGRAPCTRRGKGPPGP